MCHRFFTQFTIFSNIPPISSLSFMSSQEYWNSIPTFFFQMMSCQVDQCSAVAITSNIQTVHHIPITWYKTAPTQHTTHHMIQIPSCFCITTVVSIAIPRQWSIFNLLKYISKYKLEINMIAGSISSTYHTALELYHYYSQNSTISTISHAAISFPFCGGGSQYAEQFCETPVTYLLSKEKEEAKP